MGMKTEKKPNGSSLRDPKIRKALRVVLLANSPTDAMRTVEALCRSHALSVEEMEALAVRFKKS
jgi:hypothetical protein